MNNCVLVGAFAICITACTPVSSASAPTIESKIAQLAKVMGAVTPKKLGGEMSLDAVTAEGNTLVLKMSGLPKWRPNVTDAEAGKLLGASICDGPQVQTLLREGGRFRIDGKSASGEILPPLPICLAL